MGLFLVEPAPTARRLGYATHDGLRGAQIDLDGVRAEPLGEPVDASAHIDAATIRTQGALCAEAVGAMEEALRLTTEYLKTRKQFGVPLAKFQTLTQRAADMYVSLELARSMSLYLTMSVAEGRLDPVVAARAKVQIGRSARHIGQESIQMHGGIGLTDEYPVGHYVSRLTAIEHTLGGTADHLQVLSARLGDIRSSSSDAVPYAARATFVPALITLRAALSACRRPVERSRGAGGRSWRRVRGDHAVVAAGVR